MQILYKRVGVLTGFVLLFLLLCANAVVTRRQLAVQIDNQHWVLRSRQVLLELSKIESLLEDAETGQRGFLYTSDPKYLNPYTIAIPQIGPHIQTLAQLTTDDPGQQANISLLRGLTQKKLNELAETISLHRAAKTADEKALVSSDYGLLTMDKIRALMAQMTQEEISLETARAAAYEHSINVTIASIYLASIVAILGLILLAYFIVHEMRLREKHAAEIWQREERLRVTLTSIGDAVIATDPQAMVTFMNPVAEHLTGISFEQAKDRVIQEVFPIFHEYTHQPSENPVKKVLEQGKIVGLANHTVLQHRNGSRIPIEDSAAPIRDDSGKVVGVVLVFRDATYHRQSEDVLRRAEKLAAAARLAATVAHEINNPLEAIGNLIYLAKAVPEIPAAAKEHLSVAEDELARVSHLTRQTLGFYRESKAPVPVEVQPLIESVLKLYSNKLNVKHIVVTCEFGECPPVQAVRGELHQLVSNLLANAADAVGQNGSIGIKLSCSGRPDSPIVQLIIEDDGPGIAPQDRDQIFEPFFTTKKDVGTGLGLWVVKEIVERHGGNIQIGSPDADGGHGAVFTVRLPCNAKSQSASG